MGKIEIYSPSATAQIKHCAVDFDTRRAPVPVHLVQYDKTVPILEVALYKGNTAYKLPDGAEVNVRMGKRKNLVIYNPALGCNETRDHVYVEVTPQMTTQDGAFAPILELLVDGGVAGSSAIQLIIDRNPVQPDDVEDDSERETIQEMVNAARAAATSAANSAATAEDAQKGTAENAEKAEDAANAAEQSKLEAEKSADAAVNATGAAADSAAAAAGSAAAAEQSKTEAAESAAGAAAAADDAKEWANIAQQIAQGAQGWYATPEALRAAHPTGENGQWAIVGTTDTIWVWDSDTGDWKNSDQKTDLSNYYTKGEADGKFATVATYTITVPITGWTDGSLVWGDAEYTRKVIVPATEATANPAAVQMDYAGGDYSAYCQVSLLDTQNGSVALWASADPTATCQIRVVEVRPGALG